jgi:hypothetical protein
MVAGQILKFTDFFAIKIKQIKAVKLVRNEITILIFILQKNKRIKSLENSIEIYHFEFLTQISQNLKEVENGKRKIFLEKSFFFR